MRCHAVIFNASHLFVFPAVESGGQATLTRNPAFPAPCLWSKGLVLGHLKLHQYDVRPSPGDSNADITSSLSGWLSQLSRVLWSVIAV